MRVGRSWGSHRHRRCDKGAVAKRGASPTGQSGVGGRTVHAWRGMCEAAMWRPGGPPRCARRAVARRAGRHREIKRNNDFFTRVDLSGSGDADGPPLSTPRRSSHGRLRFTRKHARPGPYRTVCTHLTHVSRNTPFPCVLSHHRARNGHGTDPCCLATPLHTTFAAFRTRGLRIDWSVAAHGALRQSAGYVA